MKKRFFKVAILCAVAASLSLSSCIGSFGLTNKLLEWNRSIDNKFVNEVVFFAFLIVPVYEVSALADILVLNSIEFWSGDSPVACGRTVIEGNDGKYLVDADVNGYTVTSLNDGTSVRLDFTKEDQTWTVKTQDGNEFPLLTFVDDTHVKVAAGNGEMMLVEKSEAGLYAFQETVLRNAGLTAAR